MAKTKEYTVRFKKEGEENPNKLVKATRRFKRLLTAREFARQQFRKGRFTGLHNKKGVPLTI